MNKHKPPVTKGWLFVGAGNRQHYFQHQRRKVVTAKCGASSDISGIYDGISTEKCKSCVKNERS